MPRSRLAVVTPPPPAQPAPPPATTTTSAPAPRTIGANMVATLPVWATYLSVAKHCLRREARLGRLIVYKRAGKLWTDGEAVLQWLHAGEVRRRRPEGQ